MSIDEAIKHAEEVVIEQDKLCKRYDDASGYSRRHNEAIRTADAKRCEECAKEHRQLATWLKELQAHREAWEKLRTEIQEEAEFAYEDFDQYKVDVLEVDVDDLPNDAYRYGMERTLELISKYRPKEGDA